MFSGSSVKRWNEWRVWVSSELLVCFHTILKPLYVEVKTVNLDSPLQTERPPKCNIYFSFNYVSLVVTCWIKMFWIIKINQNIMHIRNLAAQVCSGTFI